MARSDQLVATCRQECFIAGVTQFVDYPDSQLLTELNDAMSMVFEDIICRARQGYWQQKQYFTTTAGVAEYPVPVRSIVGGLERIELVRADGQINQLEALAETYSDDYEWPATQRGQPVRYVVRGDQFVLFPAPDQAYTMRVVYYIRPSRLVTSQSSTQGGDAAVRGFISAVNPTARTVTVTALPLDQSLTPPATIGSANQRVDVVHADGWHELALVDAPQTIAALVITLGGADPLNRIRIGDFVRVADQTDWPALPDDFHRVLAQCAAVQVLQQMGLTEKGGPLSELIAGNIARLASLIEPRVKSAAPVFAAPPWVSGSGGGDWWWR